MLIQGPRVLVHLQPREATVAVPAQKLQPPSPCSPCTELRYLDGAIAVGAFHAAWKSASQNCHHPRASCRYGSSNCAIT